MIRRLTPADTHQILSVWQSFYPEKYWVDEGQLRTHVWEAPLSCAEQRHGIFDGEKLVAFAFSKHAPEESKYAANAEQANLQALAFARPQQGAELIAALVEGLGHKGFKRLVYGQDSRHFFPGVPTECSRLEACLRECGFQFTGDQVDLERDLATYELPERVTLDHPGVTFRTCQEHDRPAVEEFFGRVFPGRWRYDVLGKWDLEGHDTVYGMFENNRCEGFALIQDERAKMPIGGAVWKHDLGAHWGSLGPIGVSEEVRGRGLGHALLAAALLELKGRGCRQTIIDWTTLKDFYGRHGFEVTREYRGFALDF